MKSATRMVKSIRLILLILMTIAGCRNDASDSDGSSHTDIDSNDVTGYTVVDTGQIACYDDSEELSTCPSEGEPFYGQDNQYVTQPPNFTDNADGTVTDNVTGLMWQQGPDTDGDGDIDAADKLSYDTAVAGAETLNLGGYSDWRLPTIKERYSLIDFSGVDSSGYDGSDHSGLIPFIDTDYFDFAYGDTDAGERIIDAQYASGNMYVDESADDASNLGPAIDTDFFEITELPSGTTNYSTDYGYFWSSTSAYFGTDSPEYYYAWHVAFGTSVDDAGDDMHGAGAVRFDTKVEDGPLGEGGERYYNYVRLVRDAGN